MILLDINEWLDVIGCDRAYKKDMKETYEKTIPELQAQLSKVVEWLMKHRQEPQKTGDGKEYEWFLIPSDEYQTLLKEAKDGE